MPENNCLHKILIHNFRNISEIELDFSPEHNLFIGHNGQGKTNCLEAIAISCSLRSMQSLQNRDLIKADEEEAHLCAQFAKMGNAITISDKGKKALLDGKAIKSALSLMELIPIVSFIPEELSMITGTKQLRRRALDLAASSMFLDHIVALKAYDKALQHRNRLLKTWPLDHDMLRVFSDILIQEGARIIHRRLKALHELHDHFKSTLRNILGARTDTALSYKVDDQNIANYSESDLKSLLKQKSTQYYSMEHIRKVTLFGPHLDDLVFSLDGFNAKNHASRGQMRALVLSFKLAHMLAVHRIREHAPIIILDDIVSELDHIKKANLLEIIKNLNTQAFFSASDLENFGLAPSSMSVFSIVNGSAGGII